MGRVEQTHVVVVKQAGSTGAREVHVDEELCGIQPHIFAFRFRPLQDDVKPTWMTNKTKDHLMFDSMLRNANINYIQCFIAILIPSSNVLILGEESVVNRRVHKLNTSGSALVLNCKFCFILVS